MVKLNKKIRATTLIEAIIAMLIIVIAYGIGLMIFMNVSKSASSGLKLKATLQLESVLSQTKKDAKYLDEEIETDNLKIEKTVTKYEGNKSLNVLHIRVLSKDNKLLAEHREIIKQNTEE